MVIRHARVDGDFAVVAKTSKSFTSEVQRMMADLFAVGGGFARRGRKLSAQPTSQEVEGRHDISMPPSLVYRN